MDNSTHNMSEKLVQYLDGDMTGSEQNAMTMQLQADGELKGQYESLLVTREAVKLYGLKEQVAAVHRQVMEELKAPVRKISQARRVIRYSIAVAASVILVAAGIWGYNFYTLSSNKVFASNYSSYELGTIRGQQEQASAIEKAYRAKDYKQVTALYSSNAAAPVQDEFLAAMSFVEIQDNVKAIQAFKKVQMDNEAAKTELFKDETDYYLALTYIRNGDYDFALDLLRKIRDDQQHTYHEKISAKLIRQVKLLKWR